MKGRPRGQKNRPNHRAGRPRKVAFVSPNQRRLEEYRSVPEVARQSRSTIISSESTENYDGEEVDYDPIIVDEATLQSFEDSTGLGSAIRQSERGIHIYIIIAPINALLIHGSSHSN